MKSHRWHSSLGKLTHTTLNGQPVDVLFNLTVNFKLN